MKTFALRNGDLDLVGDHYAVVSGAARLQQLLGLAMREPYGGDRFHPGWGSMLPEWIGRVITQGVTQEVRAEVLRVIRNHILVQNAQLKERAMSGLSPVLTADEIISQVTDIKVNQKMDGVIAKVTIRTTGQQEFTLLTSPQGSV